MPTEVCVKIVEQARDRTRKRVDANHRRRDNIVGNQQFGSQGYSLLRAYSANYMRLGINVRKQTPEGNITGLAARILEA